jgi:hypothetical protein
MNFKGFVSLKGAEIFQGRKNSTHIGRERGMKEDSVSKELKAICCVCRSMFSEWLCPMGKRLEK